VIGLWSLLSPIRKLWIRSRAAGAVVLCASLAPCVVGVQLAPPQNNQTKATPKMAATPAPPPLPSIDGVIVEGGAEQAKASGLRLCDGDYYGFTCKKAYKVTFLGAPALRASAHLAYPDVLKLPVEKRTRADLRYEEVVFEFEPVEFVYPYEKQDAANPNACAKQPDAALAVLERKLLKEGWRF